MNEVKKEELVQLLGGWILLSPLIAYIFKMDPLIYLISLAIACYVIAMIATWPTKVQTT